MLGVFFIIGWAYRMYKSFADKILVNQYVLLISMLLVFGGVVYNINVPYLKAMVSIMLALNVANVLVGKFDCRYLEAIGKETMGIYIISSLHSSFLLSEHSCVKFQMKVCLLVLLFN